MMLTNQERKFALQQYSEGIPPSQTARKFDVTASCIIMAARRAGLKPQNQRIANFSAKRKQQQRDKLNREVSANKRAAGVSRMTSIGRGHAGTVYQEPNLPPDTRSLTARFCGDPLPGRSALDQRQGPART